ncbi:AMP-binding protein [Novosphingobium sp.]|uniref:AMP-binding protein n=1 Tax=Novosphingobium sp. TaxID=1874826 RepID=UPI003BAC72E0
MGDPAGRLAGLGVGPGVVVAVHLRNSCEYVVSEFAIQKLAAIRVPLNEQMGVPELGYCLAHSRAQVLITHADLPRAKDLEAQPFMIVVGAAPDRPLAEGQAHTSTRPRSKACCASTRLYAKLRLSGFPTPIGARR